MGYRQRILREFLHVDDLASGLSVLLMEHYSGGLPTHQRRHRRRPLRWSNWDFLAETIRDVVNPEATTRVGQLETRRHPPQVARRHAPAITRMGTVDRIGRRSRNDLSVVPRPDRCPPRCARGRGRVVLDAQLSWHDRRPGDHTADRICVAPRVTVRSATGLRCAAISSAPTGRPSSRHNSTRWRSWPVK